MRHVTLLYNYSGIHDRVQVELGRSLLPAFATMSGVPAPVVSLKSGNSKKSVRSLSVAEAGTLQLEFRDLTKASGTSSLRNRQCIVFPQL